MAMRGFVVIVRIRRRSDERTGPGAHRGAHRSSDHRAGSSAYRSPGSGFRRTARHERESQGEYTAENCFLHAGRSNAPTILRSFWRRFDLAAGQRITRTGRDISLY